MNGRPSRRALNRFAGRSASDSAQKAATGVLLSLSLARARRKRASPAVSSRTISATPRVPSRAVAASSAVRRNDFNEPASITSVNRARALTGDLRAVARVLMPPYAEEERHRAKPRQAPPSMEAPLTSIVQSATSAAGRSATMGNVNEPRLSPP